MNENGEIWKENIRFSGDIKNLKIYDEIKSYLKKFDFFKNYKIKQIDSFEKTLKNKYSEYSIKSYNVIKIN